MDRALERVHPDDRQRLADAVAEVSRTRSLFDVELRIARPSGEERIVICRGHVVAVDDTGTPIRMVGTVQDVTERRAIDAAIRRREKLASIGQLASGIAHEINNPLTMILGLAQALQLPGDA